MARRARVACGMSTIEATDPLEARDPLLQLTTQDPAAGRVPADKLRWFYREGPHGTGEAMLLRTAGAPIGCAGLGIRRLVHAGDPLRVALFADLAIDRTHRSGLPALELLRAVRAEVERRFDLGYGFPNRHALGLYRHAGYLELGLMYRYVRVVRSRRYLRPALGRVLAWPAGAVVDLGLAALARARARRAREHAVSWLADFDARFDRLWEAARERYPVACERTAAFLRWRFGRVPRRILAVTSPDTGALVGYAVLLPGDRGTVEILDLFAAGDHELDALLARLVPAAAALGATALSCWFLGDPRVVPRLAVHGFTPRGEPRAVVLAEGSEPRPRLRDPARWYLTSLDEDA